MQGQGQNYEIKNFISTYEFFPISPSRFASYPIIIKLHGYKICKFTKRKKKQDTVNSNTLNSWDSESHTTDANNTLTHGKLVPPLIIGQI